MARAGIVIALVALVMSTILLVRGFRQEREPADTVLLEEEIHRLSEEVRLLSERARQMKSAPPSNAQVPEATKGADGATDIEEAINQLSQRLGAVEQRLIATQTQPGSPTRAGRQAPSADEISAAEATAMNATATPETRVAALLTLRLANKRTPEVTRRMLEVLRSDAEPRVKADVIRHLAGLDHPELKKPLLEVLATSQDPSLKEEAIESLMPFYGEPEVMAAVTHARDNDAAEGVRKEAERRLAQWRARQGSR